jgi:dTDP-4-dehydrorhamnose 3,5-epimerase
VLFNKTPLEGAYLIELEPRRDDRGHFARAFCAKEFADHGLETSIVQANLSMNAKAGTVRGMHFQRPPHAEVKLVRCVVGELYDVIVDLRENSPTYLEWFGATLSQENGAMMYVPRGFAHGYQSLTDGATAHYMVSASYVASAEGGVRHDDPAIGIKWPGPVVDISPKDGSWPLLNRPAS